MSSSVSLANVTFFSSLVSVISGVVIAFFIQYGWSYFQKRQTRKSIASLLGYEIVSIKKIANQAIEMDSVHLEWLKKKIKGGELTSAIIGDVDLPRAVYDKGNIDLSLFEPNLAATISELYRWVAFSKHVKEEGTGFSQRASAIISRWTLGFPRNLQQDQEVIMWLNNFVKSSEGYIMNLRRIADFAEEALTGLKKIVDINEEVVKGESYNILEIRKQLGIESAS